MRDTCAIICLKTTVPPALIIYKAGGSVLMPVLRPWTAATAWTSACGGIIGNGIGFREQFI